MKRYLALLLVGSLGACNLPTLNVASQVNLNTLEGVVAGYGILVQAEQAYKSLPLCLTGTTPSATNICARRSIVVRLQNADHVANTAINTASSFVSANPTISPAQYISAASNAVTAMQTILNSAASGN